MPITPDKTYYVDLKIPATDDKITIAWKIYDKVGSAVVMYVENILIFPKTTDEQPLSTASEGTFAPGTCNTLMDKNLDCYFTYHNVYNSAQINTDFSV